LVAKDAPSQGVSANGAHGWRKLACVGGGPVAAKPLEFLPVQLATAATRPAAAGRDIEVELRRAAL